VPLRRSAAKLPGEPLGDTGLRRLEVDGVPVFWLPDARRSIISLQFRVGRSDEPFPKMGCTHLVEHLAFFRMSSMREHSNGFVDNIRTVFAAHGTPDELSTFVAGIAQAIHNLPIDRLDDESRILRTEAKRRSSSIWEQLAWFRFGAIGHGSLNLPEFGLGSITGDDLEAWTRTWFTRANAAVWIAGPLPGDLRIPLPSGTRRPVPPSEALAEIRLPAWTGGAIPGIAMGLVVPRTTATAMGGRILTRRLEQRLRYDLGASYEVSIAYNALDAREGLQSYFASCLKGEATRVRDAFVEVVETFHRDGPTAEELASDIQGFRRSLEDPDVAMGDLDRAVSNELIGMAQDGRLVLLAAPEATMPEEIRGAMRHAIDGALLVGPVSERPGVGSSLPWHDYPGRSVLALDGRRFDLASRRLPWQPRTEQLVVGLDGVTWLDAQERPVTVRYRDVVGLVVEADGTRWLFGRDGFRVIVNPAAWKHGAEAAAAVDRNVPAELTIRLQD
jgi:hypothetical protein